MIIETSGDLFANTHRAQAFAHGCNCQGVMGAGIALGFRSRYPQMYLAYRARCLSLPRQFNPGDAWLWREAGKEAVFNLASQEFYGRRGRATLPWLRASLTAMRDQATAEGITAIAMPHIGTHLGGLAVADVRSIIFTLFRDWDATIILYAPAAR